MTAVDDQRKGGGLLSKLPSLLVHPEDFAYPWCSLRTDRCCCGASARCAAAS